MRETIAHEFHFISSLLRVHPAHHYASGRYDCLPTHEIQVAQRSLTIGGFYTCVLVRWAETYSRTKKDGANQVFGAHL